MPKRKKLTMLVTVSVPHKMTPAQARKEVRTLITHQSNHANFYGNEYDPQPLEYDDVKAVSVRPDNRAKAKW